MQIPKYVLLINIEYEDTTVVSSIRFHTLQAAITAHEFYGNKRSLIIEDAPEPMKVRSFDAGTMLLDSSPTETNLRNPDFSLKADSCISTHTGSEFTILNDGGGLFCAGSQIKLKQD